MNTLGVSFVSSGLLLGKCTCIRVTSKWYGFNNSLLVSESRCPIQPLTALIRAESFRRASHFPVTQTVHPRNCQKSSNKKSPRDRLPWARPRGRRLSYKREERHHSPLASRRFTMELPPIGRILRSSGLNYPGWSTGRWRLQRLQPMAAKPSKRSLAASHFPGTAFQYWIRGPM